MPQSEIKKASTTRTSFKTPKLSDLVKTDVKQPDASAIPATPEEDNPFLEEDLQAAWKEFAEKRKAFQAEYHLLTQPFTRDGNKIIITLHPVEEPLLNHFRIDLTTFLRERLKNSTINVVSELKKETDKKIIYTSREKLDYLAEKNPLVKELKDRLGLDTDF